MSIHALADSGISPARGVTAPPGSTKARIERAALLLFVARGVDAVSTREIAERADLSEGALYRHFAGKEALAGTLFFAIHKRLAALIRRADVDHESLDARIDAIVAGYCQTADHDWPLFAYHVLSTHRFLPERGERSVTDADNPVAAAEDIVADAMRTGEIAKGDEKLIAAFALGVVLQTALHIVYGRVEGPLSKHEGALKAAVSAAICASAENLR